MRGRDQNVRERASVYLATHGRFTFSVITRYEILRGLKARQANQQVTAFEARCRVSEVLPLSDEVVDRAADIYAGLHRSGHLISDADILIAATALTHALSLATNNVAHFSRVPGLTWSSWKS